MDSGPPQRLRPEEVLIIEILITFAGGAVVGHIVGAGVSRAYVLTALKQAEQHFEGMIDDVGKEIIAHVRRAL